MDWIHTLGLSRFWDFLLYWPFYVSSFEFSSFEGSLDKWLLSFWSHHSFYYILPVLCSVSVLDHAHKLVFPLCMTIIMLSENHSFHTEVLNNFFPEVHGWSCISHAINSSAVSIASSRSRWYGFNENEYENTFSYSENWYTKKIIQIIFHKSCCSITLWESNFCKSLYADGKTW